MVTGEKTLLTDDINRFQELQDKLKRTIGLLSNVSGVDLLTAVIKTFFHNSSRNPYTNQS